MGSHHNTATITGRGWGGNYRTSLIGTELNTKKKWDTRNKPKTRQEKLCEKERTKSGALFGLTLTQREAMVVLRLFCLRQKKKKKKKKKKCHPSPG